MIGFGPRVIVSSKIAGPTLSDTVTATSLLNAVEKIILPPNFWVVGKILRITALGQVSNVVTTPGTLTLDVRLNSTPIVVCNGGAMQMSTTAHTTLPIWVEAIMTCRAVGTGTSANLIGQMIAFSQVLNVSGADTTTGHAVLAAPNSTPTVGTGFDSTVVNTLDFFGKFSVATDPTNITLQQYIVEDLN